MLPVLPKLADRNFILSSIVPSLLFAVVLVIFFLGWTSAATWLQEPLNRDIGAVVYFAGAVWLIAILLATGNYWAYRLLEGYLPPLSWFSRRRARYRVQVERTRSELKVLFERLRSDRLAGAEYPPADLARYRNLYRQSAMMPTHPNDVLPTSFGNAIKCFESYADDVYGADAVVLWPHLVPVASKEYATAVENARSQVDFLVNCSILSLTIGLISLVTFVVRSSWSGAWHAVVALEAMTASRLVAILDYLWLADIMWFGGSLIASRLLYKAAVLSVPAWGSLVMAGFDCYLPALAKQLGFDLPKNNAKRRQFWKDFSEQAYYRRRPDGTPIFKAEDWLFPRRG